MGEHKGYVEYITGQQQIVVETLLLGLRQRSLSDFFVTYDGHLKVESTRVLLEAGYSVIDNVDTDTHSASQFTLNTANGKVESSQILLGLPNCKPQGKHDIILLNPDVKFEVIGLERKYDETFETGVERMCRAKIHALVVTASESEFTKLQEQYSTLLPPVANLQSFFTESEQQFTNKKGSVADEEVVCRACKVASPATNGSRVIFSLFRPNILKKQVEDLTDNKASLEIQRDEQTEDTSYLTTEIAVLKKEIETLNSERSDIQIGSGEFEAERDLLKEEKEEVEAERDALKIEAVSLRKKIHKLELELEAFHEIKSKKTYSLSDSDDDDEIKTTTTTTTTTTAKHDESMEVGLDEDDDNIDDDDDDLKSDLIVKDDDDDKPGFTNMGGDGLSLKTLGKTLGEESDEESEKEEENKVVKKSIKIEEDDDSESEKSEKVDLDENENENDVSVTEDEAESDNEKKEDASDDEDDDKKNENNNVSSDTEKKDDTNLYSDDEVQLDKKKPISTKSIEDDDDDYDSSDWSDS